MKNMVICQWQKDTKGRFISCCEAVAENAGADSPFNLQGKTDYDLIWRDRADEYWQEEIEALSGKQIKKRQKQNNIKGDISILVAKAPLLNRLGKVIGTIGSCIELPEFTATSNHHFAESNYLQLGPKFNNATLTKRELEVLRDLLYGKTVLGIAKKLNRSARTIESHFGSLKEKFLVTTRAELIERAIEAGYWTLISE
jgi:DNA-binding CsgD family transcriptional regulator